MCDKLDYDKEDIASFVKGGPTKKQAGALGPPGGSNPQNQGQHSAGAPKKQAVLPGAVDLWSK